MIEPPKAQTLDALIDNSNATLEFKAAVRELSHGESQDRIGFNSGAPAVKVMRVVMKLLEARPDLAIERVRIQGISGCSNFTGSVTIQPGGGEIDFDWDCRWQAGQIGWKDFFGDPDQIRAARELGYQCFRIFEARQKAAAR